jgi:hypothetical protein
LSESIDDLEEAASLIRTQAIADGFSPDQAEKEFKDHFLDGIVFILRYSQNGQEHDVFFIPIAELRYNGKDVPLAIVYIIDRQELWLIYFDPWLRYLPLTNRSTKLPSQERQQPFSIGRLDAGPDAILNNSFDLKEVISTSGFRILSC